MSQKNKEVIVEKIFFLASLISILSIILISVFIFKGGLPFIKNYGLKNFLFGKEWKPSNTIALFGVQPMILGSIYVTTGALILGAPVGILTAIYLSSFASEKEYRFLKPALNLMAGIPSIIYGFFALRFIVPLTRYFFGGTGMNIISASILLAIMILPTIISLSETALDAVPSSYYEGSVALGASHEESVLKVVLPAARSGVYSSIILGLGRAIGETMAVILVAGSQARIPKSINQGVRTLTTNIVMDMSYATGVHKEALIATSVLLFVFILIINSFWAFLNRRDFYE